MGITGAICGMRELFEEMFSEGYGLSMVDAKNAFNSVNIAAIAQGLYSQLSIYYSILFYQKLM